MVGAAGDSGGGAVAVQQQEELGQPAVGNQQDLVEVNVAEDSEDKEPPRICQPRKLRSPRSTSIVFDYALYAPGSFLDARQRQPGTESYGARSDSWINEDDVQIPMPRLPRERSSQDLVPWVERDVRVRHMRYSKRSKGKRIFEYLVDEISTWVTEDQLRILLSLTLLAGLKGKLLLHKHPYFWKG